MTRGKKITITSICAVILLLLIGFVCFLLTSPKNQTMKIGDFYCQKAEDGLIIVGTDKLKAEQLIIPEKLNDMPVVEIADNAFKGCEVKNYIVYPNVKRVGEHAFDGNSDFNIIMMKRTDLSDMKVANEWNGIGKIVFNNPTPNPIETSKPKIKVKPIIPGDKSTDSKNINRKPTINKENKIPDKKARTLKDIKVSSPPIKIEYIEGEFFDINGIIVTAQYTDGSSTIIDNYWYSKEKLVNGQTSILIEYEERGIKSSTKQAISVFAKTPIKLEVTTPPTKVDYIEGDIFETVGLIAKVTYNNGDTANVTKFTVPSDKLFKGQNSVNIFYTENNKPVSAKQKITVREKSPIALVIATPPNKTQYIENEVFSSIGMVVKVNFNNNTTAIITNYIHTLEPLSEDMKYVEISYTANGKTVKANQPITVTKKVPTSLKIVTPPTKVGYIEGNVFDKTDMVVEVSYSNGDTSIVTNYTVSAAKLELGQKSVTISYKENDKEVTANQDINVVAKTPTKLEVTTPPTKTDYVEGTLFNPEGLVITVTYDNGDTGVVTPSYDNKELLFEQGFIELSYKENNKIVKVNQPITVTKKVPTALKIVTPPTKVGYIEGNVFDKTGMVVEVSYSNGDNSIVTNYTVLADKLVSGQKSVTISYKENDKEVTANQDINVVAKTPTKLEITTPPTKTDYVEGTLFNPEGLVVTVTYNNGDTGVTTDYTVSADKLVLGQKFITISYKENDKEVTTNQDINVIAKTPTKLEVTTPPTKVDYVEGTLFNPEGLITTVTYDNGDTAVVTPNYDNKELVLEQGFIELSYKENNNTVKANQPITVTKKVPTSLKIITPPNKVEYIEEQHFDDTGIEVEVEYNNGKKTIVTNYTYLKIPLRADQTFIEIGYQENDGIVSCKQAITVRKKKPIFLKITTPPAKTNYIEGNVFDSTGMVVEVTYDNENTAIVTDYKVSADKLVLGQKSVTISYKENEKEVTVTQDLNVVAKAPTKLEVTTPPTKVDYVEGTLFNSEGMIITVTYDNGDIDVVTPSYDNKELVLEQEFIELSYKENNSTVKVNQPITVTKKVPTSLKIATPPTKVEYIEEQYFDDTGIVVEVEYNNGKKAIVTNYTYLKIPLRADQTFIEIGYQENDGIVSCKQAITVSKKKPVSLKITTPPTKTNYIEGNVFDSTGMIVEVTYDNENTAIVTDYKVSSDKLVLGQKSVTISYKENDKEVTANQDINVVAKTPTKLEVTTPPKKIDYVEGTLFNPKGLVTTVTYDNGDTGVVTPIYDNKELVFEQEFIELSYKQNNKVLKVNQPITVTKKLPTSLKIVTPPTKVDYIEGNIFESTGMVVEVEYNNGKKDVVTNYTFNEQPLVSGQKSIEISYVKDAKPLKTQQAITVRKKKLSGIHLEYKPHKLIYTEGEIFNPEGISISLWFDNGTSKFGVTECEYSKEKLLESMKEIEISYTYDGIRKSEMLPITVNPQMAVYQKYKAIKKDRDITYDIKPEYGWWSGYLCTHCGASGDGDRGTFNGTIYYTDVYSDFKYSNGKFTTTGDCFKSNSLADKSYGYLYANNSDELYCIYATHYHNNWCSHVPDISYKVGKVTKVEYNVQKQGDFIENIQAKKGSLPENGLHTDGYWYVFKNLVNDTTAKKTPVKLEVYKQPNKTNYIEDMTFDKTGLAVKVTYDDNSSKTTDNVFVPGDLLEFSQPFVTVTYTENNKPLTVDVPIKVTKKTPISLSIVSMPYKTKYKDGELFESAGLKINYLADNGKTYPVPIQELSPLISSGMTDILYSFKYNNKTIDIKIPITVENQMRTYKKYQVKKDLGATQNTDYMMWHMFKEDMRPSDHPLDLNGSYGGYSFKYNPNMPGNVEIVKESKGNEKDIFLFDYSGTYDSGTPMEGMPYHFDIVYVQRMSSNSGTHYYFHGVNLPELQIEMTQVKGDFIKDVIVKDGDLPTNGVKDGYWYVASDLAN